MGGSNGFRPSWRVSSSGEFHRDAKSLAARASAAGRGADYAGELRLIMYSLAHEPTTWGTPKADLEGTGELTTYEKTTALVRVRYAVHAASRNVFLQRITASPGSPLAGP